MTSSQTHNTTSQNTNTTASENPLGRPHEFEGFLSETRDSGSDFDLVQRMLGVPAMTTANWLGVGRAGQNAYGTWGYLNIWDGSKWIVKGWTLEPRSNVGKGPIPIGDYSFDRWVSSHLGKTLRLYNVPGFTDILIHVGNTQGDTAGCILAAYSVDNASAPTRLVTSRPCVDWLYDTYPSGMVRVAS
jgi:hypothetical protein